MCSEVSENIVENIEDIKRLTATRCLVATTRHLILTYIRMKEILSCVISNFCFGGLILTI